MLKLLKKSISALVVLSIILSMSVGVFAEETVEGSEIQALEITSLYADVYGVEVVFNNAVSEDIINAMTIYEYPDEETAVTITKTASDDYKTVVITPEDQLTADVSYVLAYDGKKQGFIIDTLADVNFNDKETGAFAAKTDFGGLYVVSASDVIETGTEGDKALFLASGSKIASSKNDREGNKLKNYTLTYKAGAIGGGSSKAMGRYFMHTASKGSNAEAVNINFNSNNANYRVDITSSQVIASQAIANSKKWISLFNAGGNVTETTFAAVQTTYPTVTYAGIPKHNVGFRAINGRYDAMRNGDTIITVDTNSSVFEGKTFYKSGYFFHTMNANIAQIIDDFKITVTKLYEVIDPEYVSIDSMYADVNGISLKLADGEEFEAVSANDVSKISILNVKTGDVVSLTEDDVVFNKNEIYIKAAIEPDAVYSLKIDAGFGEEFAYTTTDFVKNFRVNTKVFADFENMEAQMLTNKVYFDTTEEKLYMSKTGTFSEIFDYNGDNKLFMIGNARLSTAQKYSNYSISFDAVPYGTNNTVYSARMYVRDTGVTANAGPVLHPGSSSGSASKFVKSDTTNTTISHIDSELFVRATRNEQVRYHHGSSTLPEGTSKATQFSEMGISTLAASTNIGLRVNGSNYQVTKAGKVLFSANDTASGSGYFGFTTDVQMAYVIDNVRITQFEELTDLAVTFMGGVNTGDVTKENLASASSVSGSVKVANLSAVSENCVVIVAAYAANNRMLNASVSDNITLGVGANETVPFNLTGLSNTVSVKAFVVDSLDNIKPLCEKIEF